MSTPMSKFGEFFADRKNRDSFWVESAKLDFTEELCKRMDELGMNRKTLATKLGCSAAAVTKMLRGQQNFTLETMVKLARVLDTELRFHLQPEGARAQWFDLLGSKPPQPTSYEPRDAESATCLEPADPVKEDAIPVAKPKRASKPSASAK